MTTARKLRVPALVALALGALVLLLTGSAGTTADSSQPPILLDVLDTGEGPLGAAANPVDNRVYTANYHEGTVSVYDGVAHEFIGTIPVGNGPQSVAVNPVTNRVYVGNGIQPTSLTVIDGESLSVVDTFPLGLAGLAGLGVATDSTTDRVYVTSMLEDLVAVLDGTTGDILDTIDVGVFPTDVVVDGAAGRAYTSNGGGDSVSVIDTSDNSVITEIPLNSGFYPMTLVVNPVTHRIYTANANPTIPDPGSVSVIDTDALAAVDEMPMDSNAPSGGYAQGLDIDVGANRLYVIDGDGVGQPGYLAVIDGATNEVVTSIELDSMPAGVAANPQVNRVYVSHATGPEPGKLSVLGLEGDGDLDGFVDMKEVTIGTDALDSCPDDLTDDAWPVDMASAQGYGKHDGTVNVLDVVQLTPPVFNSSPPNPNYSLRKDFNADGSVNILDVVRVTPPVFGTSCN
jgi:YVTN family beta-propeller protein